MSNSELAGSYSHLPSFRQKDGGQVSPDTTIIPIIALDK